MNQRAFLGIAGLSLAIAAVPAMMQFRIGHGVLIPYITFLASVILLCCSVLFFKYARERVRRFTGLAFASSGVAFVYTAALSVTVRVSTTGLPWAPSRGQSPGMLIEYFQHSSPFVDIALIVAGCFFARYSYRFLTFERESQTTIISFDEGDLDSALSRLRSQLVAAPTVNQLKTILFKLEMLAESHNHPQITMLTDKVKIAIERVQGNVSDLLPTETAVSLRSQARLMTFACVIFITTVMFIALVSKFDL